MIPTKSDIQALSVKLASAQGTLAALEDARDEIGWRTPGGNRINSRYSRQLEADTDAACKAVNAARAALYDAEGSYADNQSRRADQAIRTLTSLDLSKYVDECDKIAIKANADYERSLPPRNRSKPVDVRETIDHWALSKEIFPLPPEMIDDLIELIETVDLQNSL